MFETLMNGINIDATIASLAASGITPAVAVFGVLAVGATLLFTANKAREAAMASAACHGANGPAPRSRSAAKPMRAAPSPAPAYLGGGEAAAGAWNKAA